MDEPADPRPGEARSTIELARTILATPREPFFSPLPKLRERPCTWGEEQRFAPADPTFLTVALRVKAWGPVASESMNRPEERMDEQNEYRDPAPPVSDTETLAVIAKKRTKEAQDSSRKTLRRDVIAWVEEAGPAAVLKAANEGAFKCELEVPREFYSVANDVVVATLDRWATTGGFFSTVKELYGRDNRLGHTWRISWADVEPLEPQQPVDISAPSLTMWQRFAKEYWRVWECYPWAIVVFWACAFVLAVSSGSLISLAYKWWAR